MLNAWKGNRMLKYKIHYMIKDYADYVIIEGETEEECLDKAIILREEYMKTKGATDFWSEEIHA